MNREIKFRGLTAQGTFVYGDFTWDLPNSTTYYGEYPHRIHWPKDGGSCNQPVKRGTVGQYTGLKDKNGKEIYEGDIVRFDNSDIGGSLVIGEIMFNTDQTLSNLEWGLWTSKGYHWTDFLGILEVIGNVWENRDLLVPPHGKE